MAKAATIAYKKAGEAIILVGETKGWIGQSVWLREIAGREEGAPPPVDLALERRNGEAVRALILAGKVTACHDLSDGGLAVALSEMAMAGKIGATITALPDGPAHAVLFGEDQARYLVTTQDEAAVLAALKAAGVPALAIGTTGGDSLILPNEAPVAVRALATAHEAWLPGYMSGAIDHAA